MGLASALTTALTGLNAAEAQIDVLGNNLANAQTIGFKASNTQFATQFLQTLGLGSSPTATSGGTNPRQTGLGTQVAEITPDFTQGTVQISSNPSDLAIQGDGFFIVQSSSGEILYTRNGVFKTNSQNELVTITGERVLGYGVDDQYQIQTTQLTSLTIPLGSAAVAQATQNVFLEGVFTPTGDLANTAEVIQSAVLGNGAIPRPAVADTGIAVAPTPSSAGITAASANDLAGTHDPGDVFQYRFVYVDDNGIERSESLPSGIVTGTVAAGENAIFLSAVPNAAGGYNMVNIYRTAAGGSNFFLLDTVAADGANYLDDGTVALSTQALNTQTISGNYTYLVTFGGPGLQESRPSLIVGGTPQNIVNGRIQLSDLPLPPVPGGGIPAYTTVNVYRNTGSDPNSFYLVGTVEPGDSFTDSFSDAAISDLDAPGNKTLDFDGPKIDSATLLTNVVRRDGLNYEQLFQEGVLSFQARKGGRALERQEFTITATTTVQDYVNFMQQAMGIQVSLDDPQNPIPNSLNNILGEGGTLAAGNSITNGQIRFVGNNGVDNAISIGLSAFQLRTTTGEILTPNLGFGTLQSAAGQSSVADFVVYDSLGIPLNVRITAVLEQRTGTATTYRWFADSPDNDPLSGSEISVGTGLVTFDGEGNLVNVSNAAVSIERRNLPSASPMEFRLDFSLVTGLAAETSSLAASRQDGSAAGKLTSFIIGEDGVIRGVFSNGISRDLGQIQLARFTNTAGLEQRGQNLFAGGVNSGLPVVGNPNSEGMGSLIAGAVELSNSDIGKNLINLVLATTQYRGNARVITTAQQLFDELMNLRR